MTCSKSNSRKSRKKSRRKYKGGAGMPMPAPEISNTSSAGAIAGAINKQSQGNKEMVELNKKFSGGGKDDVTVPQMSQGGVSGNKSIVDGIRQMMQGSEDGKFDSDVNIKALPSGMPGGGRKKRKSKRKSRKSKRKSRKSKRKKRKSNRKYKRKSRKGR